MCRSAGQMNFGGERAYYVRQPILYRPLSPSSSACAMKLPRSLASLTGPSTPELQKTFLRDLKIAFRDRVDHESAPIKSSIDSHFQSILRPSASTRMPVPTRSISDGPVAVARRLYFDGLLSRHELHVLIGQTTTRAELRGIRDYSVKAGHDIASGCTDLSARYAARLLHLGQITEVQDMIARYTKEWLAMSSAHPLLIKYASRKNGITEARGMFARLLPHASQDPPTMLVRVLLSEAIRHADLDTVRFCLKTDITAALGRESRLARWLNANGDPSSAFTVLVRAEPSMAAEASVGLKIARSLIQRRQFTEASKVLRWVEGRYALSVQAELREVQADLTFVKHTLPKRAGSTVSSEDVEVACA